MRGLRVWSLRLCFRTGSLWNPVENNRQIQQRQALGCVACEAPMIFHHRSSLDSGESGRSPPRPHQLGHPCGHFPAPSQRLLLCLGRYTHQNVLVSYYLDVHERSHVLGIGKSCPHHDTPAALTAHYLIFACDASRFEHADHQGGLLQARSGRTGTWVVAGDSPDLRMAETKMRRPHPQECPCAGQRHPKHEDPGI